MIEIRRRRKQNEQMNFLCPLYFAQVDRRMIYGKNSVGKGALRRIGKDVLKKIQVPRLFSSSFPLSLCSTLSRSHRWKKFLTQFLLIKTYHNLQEANVISACMDIYISIYLVINI